MERFDKSKAKEVILDLLRKNGRVLQSDLMKIIPQQTYYNAVEELVHDKVIRIDKVKYKKDDRTVTGNVLSLVKDTRVMFDLNTIAELFDTTIEEIYDWAIKEWLINHGFGFGEVGSFIGVPIVNINSVKEENGMYRISGFDYYFEKFEYYFYPVGSYKGKQGGVNTIYEAVRIAKSRMSSSGLLCVIAYNPKLNRYYLFTERINPVKDLLMTSRFDRSIRAR